MTLKDKMKTYNFWLSLVSAIVLLLRVIGNTYGFTIDAGLVMDITTGLCGIFVILGIISAPQKQSMGDIKQMENSTNVVNNNGISFNETFKNMEEKLQNNLENIEIMAESVQNSEKYNTEMKNENAVICDSDSLEMIIEESEKVSLDINPDYTVEIENTEKQKLSACLHFKRKNRILHWR